jgi:hypothetical protein
MIKTIFASSMDCFEHLKILISNLFGASCFETGDPPEGWGVRRTNFGFGVSFFRYALCSMRLASISYVRFELLIVACELYITSPFDVLVLEPPRHPDASLPVIDQGALSRG